MKYFKQQEKNETKFEIKEAQEIQNYQNAKNVSNFTCKI